MSEQTAPWLEPVRQRPQAGWLLLDTGDVEWAQLEPDPARTTCQYKGEAGYFAPDAQL